MMSYPLMGFTERTATVAMQDGKAIKAEEFLKDVAALAAYLPDKAYVINLCKDRYRFTVGLAAALCRKHITLLPPHETPGLFAQFANDYSELYCLTDTEFSYNFMPVVFYPGSLDTSVHAIEIPSFPEDQTAVSLFTSGSTGQPQSQTKTWGTLIKSTLSAGKSLNIANFKGATLIGTVPHQHSYGLESTVLLPLQHGLIIQSERPLLPADVCRSLEAASRPRVLVTTPIHLRALLADKENLPPADLILSATAPLPIDTAQESEAGFRAPLYEIYGCSEAGQIATRRTAVESEWTCLEGYRLRQDHQGTWVNGDALPEEKLLSDVIELKDAERFLLLGRTADMVCIAGKRGSLANLTHHLTSIDGVEDGVFILPPKDAGPTPRLIAFAVAPSLSREDILSALRKHIDPAFLPRPLYLVDALPRNALGKLPREATLQLAAKVSGMT